MKKLFLTVAVVAAAMLGMTSCSNKERCWEIKITATCDDGTEEEATVYKWGTRDYVNSSIDEAKEIAEEEGCTLKTSKKHVKASDKSDCYAKNLD